MADSRNPHPEIPMEKGGYGMSDIVRHLIRCKGESVTGIRALIEHRLGVETRAEPYDFGIWFLYFNAPEDVNLDFLRPDVLPPKEKEEKFGTHHQRYT